jgi:adenylate kinase family enzyme
MLKEKGVKIDKVLNFEIADEILEERITGRWIHPTSGRSYHTKFAPPKVPGKDDVSHKGYVHIHKEGYQYNYQLHICLKGEKRNEDNFC